MKIALKALYSKWPFILYTALITVLSLFPRDRIPETGWTVMDGVDKLVHAGFYAMMYILWHHMHKPDEWSAPKWGFALCAGWGALMECLQAFVGRSFEYTDILANVIGVFIAFIIFRNK